MAKVSIPPRVNLSKLRDIGWGLWDPIGLLGNGGHYPGKWNDPPNQRFADEYDNYLISAASQLRGGASCEQVVEYLAHIEADYMGLGIRPNTRERAEAVVAAILADQASLNPPDGHGQLA